MKNELKKLLDTPVQIDLEKIKEAKFQVQLATPMFGAMSHDTYQTSILDLINVLSKANIPLHRSVVTNDSLITRARNICVAMFLANKDATHLLFVDADIQFRGDYVIKMLWDQLNNPDIDIICGAYSKKGINWKSIIDAVKNGHDDYKTLTHQNQNFAINPMQKKIQMHKQGLIEVHDGATGFMLISRKAIEKLVAKYQHLKYENDIQGQTGSYTDYLYALFNTGVEGQGELKHIKKTKRFLSEDYYFSRLCQKHKIKIWLDPRIHLGHVGQYIYGGDNKHIYNRE